MKKLLIAATLVLTFGLSSAFVAPAEACPCSKSKQVCSPPKDDNYKAPPEETAKKKRSKQKKGKRS